VQEVQVEQVKLDQLVLAQGAITAACLVLIGSMVFLEFMELLAPLLLLEAVELVLALICYGDSKTQEEVEESVQIMAIETY
jgi:hypothetical protein